MKVAVIGSGVIGLTTAIALMREGRDVVIYSKDIDHKNAKDTVSLVACALWQPYKLYKNIEEFDRDQFESIKKVSLDSLIEFDKILSFSNSNSSGIYIRTHYEYSSESIYDEYTHQLKRDFYYIDTLREFWSKKGDNNAILDECSNYKNPGFKAVSSSNEEVDFKYLHGYKTYVIDPSVFLGFLKLVFNDLGGEIVERKINSNELKKLKEKVIFNCAGINGYSIINSKNFNSISKRKIEPKNGVLLIYKLKSADTFINTIVLDELTILCRKNYLTIGTGEVKQGEDPSILIERLKRHTKAFLEAGDVEKFGFDFFVKSHDINIDNPDEVLLGSRPYFPDGKGYLLNREEYTPTPEHKIVVYNNFGHGGSGVTLSLGCAKEVTDLYLKNVKKKLNCLNEERIRNDVSEFSIEVAHFNIRELYNLSDNEMEELVSKEKAKLKDVYNKLNLYNRKVSISVLIDDKESKNEDGTILRFNACLNKIGVDYVVYESSLINYVNSLEQVIPSNLTKELNYYQHYHYKLACSQDIFVWYCLRFGIIPQSFDEEFIQTITLNPNKKFLHPFSANTLITILDKGLKNYEENAEVFLSKSFGFEIASSVRRFYY